MLCMAMIMTFAAQGAAQAFEAGDHAAHHATQGQTDGVENHHHCEYPSQDEPAEPLGEPHHHHHADHHVVSLGADLTTVAALSPMRDTLAPTGDLGPAGVTGAGLERPPKA